MVNYYYFDWSDLIRFFQNCIDRRSLQVTLCDLSRRCRRSLTLCYYLELCSRDQNPLIRSDLIVSRLNLCPDSFFFIYIYYIYS